MMTTTDRFPGLDDYDSVFDYVYDLKYNEEPLDWRKIFLQDIEKTFDIRGDLWYNKNNKRDVWCRFNDSGIEGVSNGNHDCIF